MENKVTAENLTVHVEALLMAVRAHQRKCSCGRPSSSVDGVGQTLCRSCYLDDLSEAVTKHSSAGRLA